MSLWPITLLLSLLMLTNAEDDLAADLDKPPLRQPLYLFDVYSDACIDKVLASLDIPNVTVLHRFKEVGMRHYYFVIRSPDVKASLQLEFPEGSYVTEYPLEHVWEYFRLFGVGNWTQNDTEQSLPNDVLHLDVWEFLPPKDTTTAQFRAMMTEWATQYTATQAAVKPMGYATPARYPPMMFFFVKFDDNALQYVVLNGLDVVGGPANIKYTNRHVVLL